MIVSKFYIEDLFLEEISINFGDKLNMPDCVNDGDLYFEKVSIDDYFKT